MSLTTYFERNQSRGSGYTDAIYFAGSYISKKDEIYTFSLDGSEAFKAKFDYTRNINGFFFKVSSNYSLVRQVHVPDYGLRLEISNKF